MNDSRNDETIGGFKTVANHHAAEPLPRPAEPATIGGMPTLVRDGPAGKERWAIEDDKRFHSHRWQPGEEILGRYVVEKELGQGGMGVVYGCFDKVGGVRVAVKALPPELSHNTVEMEEVRENFALVDELRHPNIAGVRTLEKDERGEYFLVMDIAEGESLRRWIRHKWKAGGVSFAEAIPILRQIAAALDYAHKMRVVHRDVKPGNVMIDNKRDVKVLDFGLAAQIRTSLSRASQAYRGTSGTGPYMAPEQWKAQPQNAKADQYALGVMAYEMLSGRLPFENSETSVLKDAVLHDEVPTIMGLPKHAMAVLRRAMAKKAENRFASCGEFVAALAGRAVTGQPGSHGSAGTPRPTLGKWVALALLLAIAGAGAWILWRDRNAITPFRESPEHPQELATNAVEAERLAEEARKAEEERLAAEKKAEEARLAAEKKAEEERLAAEKAAQEEAARLEAERVKAEWEARARAAREQAEKEAAEAQRRLQEAERRAQEAEAARTKAEEEAAQRQRDWEERLSRLEQQARQPVATQTANAGVSQTAGARQAGETKSIELGGGVKLEMVSCPGVGPDFWMGKYEVTQEQWQQVMGTNPSFFHFGGKPKNPVEQVSWNDCQNFVRKLNALPAARSSGLTFRLPTEGEWKTACRAGAPKGRSAYCKLADGTQITADTLSRVARYGKEYDDGPTRVGSLNPNAWGLYDMHGNVWELTETARAAFETDKRRVRCGGSFLCTAGACSTFERDSYPPDHTFGDVGLRLAASGR